MVAILLLSGKQITSMNVFEMSAKLNEFIQEDIFATYLIFMKNMSVNSLFRIAKECVFTG